MKFENDIVLISDENFRHKFVNFKMEFISAESLIDNYNENMDKLNNTFRNGFWKLTSYRFNILHEYMFKYNVNNILHIENDVVLYKNLND